MEDIRYTNLQLFSVIIEVSVTDGDNTTHESVERNVIFNCTGNWVFRTKGAYDQHTFLRTQK